MRHPIIKLWQSDRVQSWLPPARAGGSLIDDRTQQD